MNYTIKLILMWTLAFVLIAGIAIADVPRMINYQGRLTDISGDPVSDSSYVVTFRIWDDSAIGANILWEEEDTVLSNNGLFSLFLGKNHQLTDSVFSEINRYLGIQISGQGEIYPRTRFTSVPYVYRVSTVDGASGGDINGNVEINGHMGIGTEPLESYVLSICRGSTDIGGLVNIIDSSQGASVYIEKIDDGPGLWISNKGDDGIGIYNEIDAGVGLSIIQKASSPALDIREDTTGGAGILLTVESDGEVGIGNHPSEKLEVSGIIYSNTGGFRFPDGTVQTTAMTGTITGIIPIGGITAWLKSFPNTPALSDNFVECNGQTLIDIESLYDGQIMPNLNGTTEENKRFLRGSTSSGAIGGAATHFHDYVSRNWGCCSSSQNRVGEGNNIPPYYEVVWIIRVK